MQWHQWAMLAALSVFLAEGFVLAVFPQQFLEMLRETEPRTLQWVGLVETILVLGLVAAVVAG